MQIYKSNTEYKKKQGEMWRTDYEKPMRTEQKQSEIHLCGPRVAQSPATEEENAEQLLLLSCLCFCFGGFTFGLWLLGFWIFGVGGFWKGRE
jgi:hypothetical protein